MSDILPGIASFLGSMGSVLVVIFMLFAIFGGFLAATKWRVKVGYNEALVVFGGRDPRIKTAGADIVLPVWESYTKLPLEVLSIEVPDDEVLTKPLIRIVVDWIAQVQIDATSKDGLATAARNFSGKSIAEIKEIALKTLSANLREIIATLEPEQVNADKETYAAKVQEVAAPEMKALGLRIILLSVREIKDRQGYFEQIAKQRRATVEMETALVVAETDRQAREKKAQQELLARQAELDSQEKQAIAEANLKRQKADLQLQTDKQIAGADAAYATEKAVRELAIATNLGAVETEKNRVAALAAEQAIALAEKRSQAEVVIPAQARKQATLLDAEAQKRKTIAEAEAAAEALRVQRDAEANGIKVTMTAEAEGTKAKGDAQASATQANLLAQADGERKLAEARSAQGQVNLVLEIAKAMIGARIEIAKANSAAMAGVGENMKVVQFGGQGGNGQTTGNALFDTLQQLPFVLEKMNITAEALSGKDVRTIIAEVMELVKGAGVVTADTNKTNSEDK